MATKQDDVSFFRRELSAMSIAVLSVLGGLAIAYGSLYIDVASGDAVTTHNGDQQAHPSMAATMKKEIKEEVRTELKADLDALGTRIIDALK